MKNDIFEFNHIDKLLSEEEVKTLKEFYKFTSGLTLNPIVLGVINGFGILLTNFGKMKNYKKKIEMTKIAFTTYDKVLVELRSAMRGDEFDKNQFIDKMKLVDEMIIDQTPLADNYVKKYDKKYK